MKIERIIPRLAPALLIALWPVFLSACGGPSLLTGPQSALPLRAQNRHDASLELPESLERARSYLVNLGHGPLPLVEISGRGLDRQGVPRGGPNPGWHFVFTNATGSIGVGIPAMGKPYGFTRGGIRPFREIELPLPDVTMLIAKAFPDGPAEGTYRLVMGADPGESQTVATLQDDSDVGFLVALGAHTGRPYEPTDQGVKRALVQALGKFAGEVFKRQLNPQNRRRVSILQLVAEGHLTARQAKRIDSNRDGHLDESEYVATTAQSGLLYGFYQLAGGIFDFHTRGKKAWTRDMRKFEVPFGSKYEEGRKVKPIVVVATIFEIDFRAADLDGDGLLSRTEAVEPIAFAVVDGILAYPQAIRSAAETLLGTGSSALPWVH